MNRELALEGLTDSLASFRPVSVILKPSSVSVIVISRPFGCLIIAAVVLYDGNVAPLSCFVVTSISFVFSRSITEGPRFYYRWALFSGLYVGKYSFEYQPYFPAAYLIALSAYRETPNSSAYFRRSAIVMSSHLRPTAASYLFLKFIVPA